MNLTKGYWMKFGLNKLCLDEMWIGRRGVQRGVQRGAFSPTSGATPATPTLGATPKFLSATPKDFVPSEKAKRSLLLLQNI